MCKFIRIIELKIIIEGRIYNNLMDIYLKSGVMPMLWRKFYVKVVKDREHLYNKPAGFILYCCEKHLRNLNSCKR